MADFFFNLTFIFIIFYLYMGVMKTMGKILRGKKMLNLFSLIKNKKSLMKLLKLVLVK